MRTVSLANIAGIEVSGVVDYSQGIDGLPAANVIEFRLNNGDKVIVRPSGTEPKIKAYLFARGVTYEAANEAVGKYEAAVEKLLG